MTSEQWRLIRLWLHDTGQDWNHGGADKGEAEDNQLKQQLKEVVVACVAAIGKGFDQIWLWAFVGGGVVRWQRWALISLFSVVARDLETWLWVLELRFLVGFKIWVFFFFFKETQLYYNFLTPSRKMIETTLWWRKTWWWGIFFFFFFFWDDIFWLFPAVKLQQIGVCSDTKYDAGQPEQNWNNNKIKGYDLGVNT